MLQRKERGQAWRAAGRPGAEGRCACLQAPVAGSLALSPLELRAVNGIDWMVHEKRIRVKLRVLRVDTERGEDPGAAASGGDFLLPDAGVPSGSLKPQALLQVWLWGRWRVGAHSLLSLCP